MRKTAAGRIGSLVLKSLAFFPSAAQWREQRREFAACALSGLAGWFTFQQLQVGWLAWIALIPWFWALGRLRGKTLVWGTFIFGTIWYYGNLWWINTLTIFNPFIPVGAVLLPLIESIYFVLFAVPAAWVMRSSQRWFVPWAVAALWVGAEYLRSLTDIAFPWNCLGHSQVQMHHLIQWADVAGVYGISFFVALFNAATLILLIRMRASAESHARIRLLLRTAAAYAVVLALLVVANLLGLGKEMVLGTFEKAWERSGRNLKVAVVQPNVSQIEKWESENPETSDERRFELQKKQLVSLWRLMREAGAQHPQLIVLPETALTAMGFCYDEALHRHIEALSRELNSDIFFGADNRIPRKEYLQMQARGNTGPSDAETTHFTIPKPELLTRIAESGSSVTIDDVAVFNSAWLVKPGIGLTNHVYNKIQLVPFGETAPLVDMIPYFQEKIMMVGSFQKGVAFTTFETSGTRYGGLICFESAFAALARGLARNGAQMICVLTNDAWYDPNYLIQAGGFWGTLFQLPVLRSLAASGPDQHFEHSIFRAIETRLPVIRAANTGVSAIVLPSGRVAETIPFRQQGILIRTVLAPGHDLTFYTRYGDWFAQLCLALLCITWLWQIAIHGHRLLLKTRDCGC